MAAFDSGFKKMDYICIIIIGIGFTAISIAIINYNIHFMKTELVILCICTSILSSCGAYKHGAGEENLQKSYLTVGIIKSKVIKGKTTQTEILELFGAPNLITKNKNDQEVWSYNRMSQVDKGGVSEFLFGAKSSESTSSQSFDFIVIFGENETVDNYSIVSTSF